MKISLSKFNCSAKEKKKTCAIQSALCFHLSVTRFPRTKCADIAVFLLSFLIKLGMLSGIYDPLDRKTQKVKYDFSFPQESILAWR